MTSKLLINEPPLQVLPTLAKAIGLNEALVLQQLHYWISKPKVGVEKDGRKWVRNTVEEWQRDNFPFWHTNTIARIFNNLRDNNLILATKSLNKKKYDKTLWYSIDYNALAECADLTDPTTKMVEGSAKPNHQNGGMDTTKMVEPIPETTRDYKEDSKTKTLSATADGDPSPAKPKSEHVLRSEFLEAVFARERKTALPDWDADPRAANKRWRTPINRMLKQAGGDVDLTARGIVATVDYMRERKLTFACPDQIEKTFEVWIIDRSFPGQNNNHLPQGV